MRDLCSGPICLREIQRQYATGDYRFTVDVRTSLGPVKIKGWRWLRTHNRITAPTCLGHHLIVAPTNVRSIIRKLLSAYLLETRNFVVPSIGRRPKRDKDHKPASDNEVRD